MDNFQYFPIRQWAEEDRPREKLINRGRSSLSNAELLAILIGSGSRSVSAVDLAKQILSTCNNDLTVLGKLEVADLRKFKGIGEVKALSIIAATELAKRRRRSKPDATASVRSSRDAYQLLAGEIEDLRHEEFKVLLLKRNNRVIRLGHVSSGGVSGTVVDPKIIFKQALDAQASSIILCHNHPSGNLKPSQADIDITKKIVASGKMLDIQILDHIIISDSGYYSFADEGLL